MNCNLQGALSDNEIIGIYTTKTEAEKSISQLRLEWDKTYAIEFVFDNENAICPTCKQLQLMHRDMQFPSSTLKTGSGTIYF